MEMLAGKNNTIAKPVAASDLDKRIDKKLDIVAKIFADAIGSRWKETISSFFSKELVLKGCRYLKEMQLNYRCENRFFSRSYNLEMRTEIFTKEMLQKPGDCVFQVQSKGRLSIRDAEWVCKEFHGKDEDKNAYLARLNNRLIIDRIVALDMTRVSVSHQADSDKWIISCESMVGSATWILIPPVTSLIKPNPEECVKVIEFFELTADALLHP